MMQTQKDEMDQYSVDVKYNEQPKILLPPRWQAMIKFYWIDPELKFVSTSTFQNVWLLYSNIHTTLCSESALMKREHI